MILTKGIPTKDRPAAAALYWEAFGSKLGRVMGPAPRARVFIENVLCPDHGISAHAADGTLLGVVGFKTAQGALVGGSFSDFRAVYGYFGATWRALLLALLERDIENERFLMDGIFVAPQARGQGVGSRLLDAVAAEATLRGYREIRLDVIDSNHRARALYERSGFVAVGSQHMGPLKHLFGFDSATTMVRRLGEGGWPSA
jgi:ribosomal protein S18 acetylase RimI-like enzyme